MGKETARSKVAKSAKNKAKQTNAEAQTKAMRKRLKRGPKLVVSAEVSPKVWDAVEKRVRSGDFKNRSDLVRTAIDRLLE